MIDFHSHVLPGIDDGPSSVRESQALLSALSAQGVDTVFATPHFDASRCALGDFLTKRQQAREKLTASASALRLGAEVAYYPGIIHLQGLEALCLEGTRLLLLEMPFARWRDATIRELRALALLGGPVLLLAHFERYLPLQPSGIWDVLCENGIRLQTNADFFTARNTRRKALRFLENGYISALGSDCHDLTVRPPQMAQARDAVTKKGGDSLWTWFEKRQAALLQEACPPSVHETLVLTEI